METVWSSETSANLYRTIRRHPRSQYSKILRIPISVLMYSDLRNIDYFKWDCFNVIGVIRQCKCFKPRTKYKLFMVLGRELYIYTGLTSRSCTKRGICIGRL
jgi:hypothetical protein